MATNGNLFFRNDTIFGVCEGLGEDLGINPNLVRVPLAVGIMFAPLWVIGIYAALGLVVFGSRWLFPDQVPAVADVPAEKLTAAHEAAVSAQDDRELAEAA